MFGRVGKWRICRWSSRVSEARRSGAFASRSRPLISRRGPHIVLVLAVLCTAGMGAVTLWLQMELRRAAEVAHQEVLAIASAAFQETIAQARVSTRAQVRVMADDARIRTTLATPRIDPETIEDVLGDLIRAGGLNFLALLDMRRKVVAVAGDDSLRGIDLGNSAIFEDASASTMWSSTDRLLAAAYAPVNLGFEQYFLLGTTALAQDRIERLGSSWDLSVALVLNGLRSAQSLRSPEDGVVIDALLGAGGSTSDRRSFRSDVLSKSPRMVRVVFLMPANRRDVYASMSVGLWFPLVFTVVVAIAGIVVTGRRRYV